MRRVNLQVYRLPVDALVVARNARSLVLDLPLDICKVVEFPPWNMMKLGPFLLLRNACWGVRYMDLIAFRLIVALAGDIDEL